MSQLPSQSDDLPPVEFVQSKPSTAKMFGVLDIIFGSLLLLWAGCSGVSIVMSFAMQPVLGKAMDAAAAAEEKQHKANLDRLDLEEKAAKTPQEKAKIQTRRAAMKAQQPAARALTFPMFNLTGPALTFGIVETSTSFLLNLLMLIAGIGLVRLKEWGRVMALWVAVAKCVRLPLLYGYGAMVMAPLMSKQLVEMFEEMEKNGPQNAPRGGPNPGEMATLMGTMMTIWYVAIILFGLIYPLVCLWFLTRPAVKAACEPGDDKVTR